MTTLLERLDNKRAEARSKTPPEVQAIMDRTTQDLVDSGAINKVIKRGSRVPEFTLPDTNGNAFRGDGQFRDGALIITFYRGMW